MRRALSNCRLYSWMRLIWQSKMVSGSTVWPDFALSQSANCAFGLAFGAVEGVAKSPVVGQRFELAQLAEVGDPAIADGFA